jgi:hypothetical protein
VRRLALMTLAMMCLAAFAQQPVDRSSPPVDAPGSGGFRAQRLPGRVGIDGRAWMFADVHTGKSGAFTPAGADYELRFSEGEEKGDVERWTVTLERRGSAPVRLTDRDKTSFVYVTPDARYIFLEPLVAIDTRTWRRYALHTALGIEPYISIVAITRDGRLFLERSSCSMDCSRRTNEEYFEVTLPAGD